MKLPSKKAVLKKLKGLIVKADKLKADYVDAQKPKLVTKRTVLTRLRKKLGEAEEAIRANRTRSSDHGEKDGFHVINVRTNSVTTAHINDLEAFARHEGVLGPNEAMAV